MEPTRVILAPRNTNVLDRNAMVGVRGKRKAEGSPLLNPNDKKTNREILRIITNKKNELKPVTNDKLDAKKNIFKDVVKENGNVKAKAKEMDLKCQNGVIKAKENPFKNVKAKVVTRRSVLAPINNNVKDEKDTNAKKPARVIQTRSRKDDIDNNNVKNKDGKIKESKINTNDSVSKRVAQLKVSSTPDLFDISTEGSLNDSLASIRRRITRSSAKKEVIYVKDKIDLSVPKPPPGVIDFDLELYGDTHQASHYAMDTFEYMKARESYFKIRDYMHLQKEITALMRALLIDWLVDMQENFELNHETLYLAVKLTDKYMTKIQVARANLQLVGATSLWLACKYEEKYPPSLDDIVYVCDNAYDKNKFKKMELSILQACDFEMGFPLSYRFLRRYARCAKLDLQLLTLARFILEYSLMNYETVILSDSKLAAAALHIALKMKHLPGWNATLEYYSGYKVEDFYFEVQQLNTFLSKPKKSTLMKIWDKYTNEAFFKVAETPLVQL